MRYDSSCGASSLFWSVETTNDKLNIHKFQMVRNIHCFDPRTQFHREIKHDIISPKLFANVAKDMPNAMEKAGRDINKNTNIHIVYHLRCGSRKWEDASSFEAYV
ncbi:unnamed protein product [Spodoptera exigua]|nr:unnamed protein product [Spodoptera exigua]